MTVIRRGQGLYGHDDGVGAEPCLEPVRSFLLTRSGDDPNLVSSAGVVPALRLAESAGLYDALEGLTVPSPDAGAKTTSLVGGLLAGAGCIDDMDLPRHGDLPRLFGGVREPSS